jgi:hypothetical protein
VSIIYSRKSRFGITSFAKLFDLVLTNLRAFTPYNECNRDFARKFIYHSAIDPKELFP